jgi:predicted RNase H-like HicB family nuclease
MAERHIILTLKEGGWFASYSDAPEDRFQGVTMQEAVNKLQQARGVEMEEVESKPSDQQSDDGLESA